MTRLASAVAELTCRLDASEARVAASEGPGTRPPAPPVDSPGGRLEAVERQLERLTALFEDSRRDGCERQDAARALQEGVTRVAGQIRRGEARAELHALQARDSLWALRCRVERLEALATGARGEVISSPAVSEDALARLAKRLDAIEAGVAARGPSPGADAAFEHLRRRFEEGQQHTLSALATLCAALGGLEQLVRLAGAAPPGAALHGRDAHSPSVAPLDRLAEAPAATATDASLDVIETAVRELAEQVAAAEQRSSRTVGLMGHEVVRVAQHLDGRVEEVERRSDARALELGAELGRLSRAVEDRLERADHVQINALRTIGGQIGTIATQLTDRIAASERTSSATVARGLAGVTEQLQRTSESLHHRLEREAQNQAVRLRKNESRLDRLSAELSSQAAGADLLAPLVLGEAERKIPSITPEPTPRPPVQQAPPTPRRPHQSGPPPASSPTPFERTRPAALERIQGAESAAPSETGSLRSLGPDMMEGADAPLSTEAAVVPVLVTAPPYASSTRGLIDSARAAARSAAETSTRGARLASSLHLDPRAGASPGAPNVLRAGLSLLRERAKAR